MIGVIFLVLFGLCAIVCHNLALRWGMKPVFWGVMGFLFGPFAIVALLFAKGPDEPER